MVRRHADRQGDNAVLPDAPASRVKIEIVSDKSEVVGTADGATTPGLHRLLGKLKRLTKTGDLVPVAAGEYVVRLKVGEEVCEQKIEIKGP